MRVSIRRLFWVEAGLATITGLLAFVTPIFPDWIELVFGWDPDRSDGSAERLIVAVLCLVTVVLVAAARREWRRTSTVTSA
jgi:hypothetical protein